MTGAASSPAAGTLVAPPRPAHRLGVIVPSSNTVVEPDFTRHLPDDVGLHTARMRLVETTPDDERAMLGDPVRRAAADLGTLAPQVVAFACTSAGALLGGEGEQRLERELAEIVGAPLVSTNHAVAAALRRRGAATVVVLTPYIDALNEAIAATLRARGVEVRRIAGMGLTDNYAIAEVEPAAIVDFARERLAGVACDAVFASCTNLRAWDAAPALEQALGRPVVTSNMATLELALARIGAAHASASASA
jgi:maleate isomerase